MIKIFFPPGWTYAQQNVYLEERGLRSVGSWALRGYYPAGPRETPFDKIVWCVTCWLPF